MIILDSECRPCPVEEMAPISPKNGYFADRLSRWGIQGRAAQSPKLAWCTHWISPSAPDR